MELKVKALENFINEEIEELKSNGYTSSSTITIYLEDGIEVQVRVTNDEDDLINEVYKPYLQADF